MKVKLKTILLTCLLVLCAAFTVGGVYAKYVFEKDAGGFTVSIKPIDKTLDNTDYKTVNTIEAAAEESGVTLTRVVFEYWNYVDPETGVAAVGYTDPVNGVTITDWEEGTPIDEYGAVRVFVRETDGGGVAYVLSESKIYAPTDAKNMFSGTASSGDAFKSSVEEIVLTNFHFPTKTVWVDATGMFAGNTELTTLDLSGLDFTRVNIKGAFTGCTGVKHLDLSGATLRNNNDYCLGNFNGMSGLESIDLTGVHSENVENMSKFFLDMSNLTTITNLSDLDISNATNMSFMFSGCRKLPSSYFLEFAQMLKDQKNKVTSTRDLFTNCQLNNAGFESFVDALVNYRAPGAGKISDMQGTFSNCNSLNGTIDISALDGTSVSTVYGLFIGCSYIEEIIMFETSGTLTSFWETFKDCRSLKRVDLSLMNTSKVVKMVNLFYNDSQLEEVIVGANWSTAKVTESDKMFGNGESFSPLTKLVGRLGTSSADSSYRSLTYARVDAIGRPGLFTVKDDYTKRPYTAADTSAYTLGTTVTVEGANALPSAETLQTENAALDGYVLYGWLLDDGIADAIVLDADLEANLTKLALETVRTKKITPLYVANS